MSAGREGFQRRSATVSRENVPQISQSGRENGAGMKGKPTSGRTPFQRLSSKLRVSTAKNERQIAKTNVITETFNRRVCCKFVPRSTALHEGKWCKCGQHLDGHVLGEFQSFATTADWNHVTDTKKLPTNAYGEIDFLNNENDILPLYIRCEMDVEVEKLGNLLLKMWAIPRPNLLISVFGGHSEFDSKKLASEAAIKEGLVKAARDTKAWLFTSGVDHGVSNLVGDAVAMKRSFVNSIPVIGVNSWGAVHDNEELIEGEDQGRFPASYTAVPLEELEIDADTKKPKTMCLEHEHTHFILLDFGTKNNFHEEEVREFRIKLQEHLRTRTEAQLVSVLIEGGSGSLEEAHKRINKGLPIVVLGDSGRISSVIAQAVELAKDTKVSDCHHSRQGVLKNDDRLKVKQALMGELPDFEETKYDEMMDVIEDIISHEELVTVWRSGKGIDLDTAILEGLIKSIAKLFPVVEGYKGRGPRPRVSTLDHQREKQRDRAKALMKRQLELAIQWDRLDIATEYIFENKSKVDLIFTESELNDMLGLAIQHKQTRFIRNIIAREANIKTFLTVKRFETMLKKITPENSLLYELLQEKCANPEDWTFEHFEMIIHDISEGVFKVPGKTKPSTTPSTAMDRSVNNMILKAIKKCVTTCGEGCQCSYRILEQVPEPDAIRLEEGKMSGGDDPERSGGNSREYEFEDPASLLTVYMVMIHEQEMAKVLWEYSPTSLFLSLVCTCIHKWMHDKRSDSLFISDFLGEQLQKYAEEFVEISYKVLEEVAKYKTEHVIALVNFKFDKWGGKSILEMADYVNAIEIIAHPTIQDYIDVEWNGWLDSDMSTFRTILSLPCPLLASFRNFTPFDKWKRKNISDTKKKSRDRLQAFIDRGDRPHAQSESDKNELDTWTKIKYFYKAPLIKFWIYTLTYGAFLFGYMCALILRSRAHSCKKINTFRQIFGCKLSMSQEFTYMMVFCLIPLEIRQVYFSYPTTVRGKLKMYFSSFYNKTDALSIVIIMLALVFKMNIDPELPNYELSRGENMFRLLFAFAFILFCLKLCQALEKSEQIGPKVMMMTKMLIDLQFFIFLVLIFVIGYGVSTTSIMYPQKFDNFTSSSHIIFDIFWRPYQNMFGEIGDPTLMSAMSNSYCILENRWNKTYCETKYSCETAGNTICTGNVYIVRFLLALYMMFAAVLMLNLMVAVFTSTYDDIQERYKSHWKRQKFDLMIEYRSRSPLPVPFSTILHCGRFLLLVFRKTCGRFVGCCGTGDTVETIDVHHRLTITLLEIECRRNYIDKKKGKTDHEILQSEISKLSSEVGNIDKRLEDFETKVQKVIDIAQPAYEYEDSVFRFREPVSYCETVNSGDEIETEGEVCNRGISVITEETDEELTESVQRRSSSIVSWKSQYGYRLTKMGKKSRKSKYPGEKNIRRTNVKLEHWDWRKLLLKYEPLEHTDPCVPCERKLAEIKWHCKVDEDERRSYEGFYEIRNQLPLNPCGRTGLSGRGLLDKYGPNHVALPVITRYGPESSSSNEGAAERRVLEVLLDCSRDETWCLPEIKGIYDDILPIEVRDLLTSEPLLSAEVSQEKLVKRIESVLKAGVLIYKGFLDSEYNTDNSWMEAIIVSYHDVKDKAFRHLTFPEGSDYRWRRLESWAHISETHREYLQRAFYSRNVLECASTSPA